MVGRFSVRSIVGLATLGFACNALVLAQAPAPAPAPGVVKDGPAKDNAERASAPSDRKSSLKEQALADASVQAMLEVFPAEIRDVEEM